MRFFSKLVFICNGCFIVAVVLRFVEIMKNKNNGASFHGAIGYQPVESTIIVLGYGAVFLNFFFFVSGIYWLMKNRGQQIPLWIVVFNMALFPLQVCYFLA